MTGGSKARELFGDAYVDRTRDTALGGNVAELLQLADRTLFDQVYTRPGLTMQQRSLITLAALTVLGKDEQLDPHVRGALNVGISSGSIREVVTQMAFYGGFPSALNAMRVVDAVLGEVAADEAPEK